MDESGIGKQQLAHRAPRTAHLLARISRHESADSKDLRLWNPGSTGSGNRPPESKSVLDVCQCIRLGELLGIERHFRQNPFVVECREQHFRHR